MQMRKKDLLDVERSVNVARMEKKCLVNEIVFDSSQPPTLTLVGCKGSVVKKPFSFLANAPIKPVAYNWFEFHGKFYFCLKQFCN